MELTPISRPALPEDELDAIATGVEPEAAPDELVVVEKPAYQLPALNSSSADDAVEDVSTENVVPKGDAAGRFQVKELTASTTLETADLTQQAHESALVNSLQQLMDDCLQLNKDQKVSSICSKVIKSTTESTLIQILMCSRWRRFYWPRRNLIN